MLSGSELDELDAQLEQFIIQEEGSDCILKLDEVKEDPKEASISPTQPLLLSQHAAQIQSSNSKQISPPKVS